MCVGGVCVGGVCVGVATFTSTLELDANFLIEELSKFRAH